MTDAADTTSKVIDVNRIMEMIPHRHPFLLIDKVINLQKDVTATGIKCVTYNEPFFPGHFPKQPVMPGVLIIEAMAQTSAVLVVETMGQDAGSKLVYFMSIEEAKFRKPVVPGDRLELVVTKDRSRGNVWKFNAEARVDGQKVADATFSAMIVDA